MIGGWYKDKYYIEKLNTNSSNPRWKKFKLDGTELLPKAGFGAHLLQNNTILLFGGFKQESWLLNLDNKSIEPSGDLPYEELFTKSTSMQQAGKIFAFGENEENIY